MSGSIEGIIPHSKSRSPPYFLGILETSMNAERVGFTCSWERMKIFDVVIGSNHFLTQPHTVGKKDGAPMIWLNVRIPLLSDHQDGRRGLL